MEVDLAANSVAVVMMAVAMVTMVVQNYNVDHNQYSRYPNYNL